MEPNAVSAWLPLGSAHVIDWKHLARPMSARGATAWVAAIDEDSVILRAWGEETTSFFDFVFLADERIAGTIVVTCARVEGGRLRIKTVVDVEGQLSFSDSNEFKEHPRTMLFTHVHRTVDVKSGAVAPGIIPMIGARGAEIFEIAPDSALQTVCGGWLSSLLKLVRDQIRGGDSVVEPRPANERPAIVRKSGRDTVGASVEVRGIGVSDSRHDGDGASASSSRDPAGPDGKRSKEKLKLRCTTNSGEAFDIAGEQTYIGRSKQCAIVLKSQRVSRKHACITKEADGFYINDLGAANGIWQGSEKIDRERIKPGDEYIVGDVALTFTFA